MTLPNIVIFMPDQWRGDYTGAAGHPYVRTPSHDRLAADGTVFTHACTTHPICGPSRTSFCTGWYPHTRGHRSQEYLIRHDEPHLFQYLKDAGYHIAWGGKNDMLERDLVTQTVDTRLTPTRPSTNWGENPYDEDDDRFYSFYHGRLEGDPEDHRDVQVVRAGQEFLRNPPQQPFCLLLTPGFPHPPYAAPEPWFSMYTADDVDDAVATEYQGLPAFMKHLNHASRMDRVDAEHVRKIRAVYAAMITMMDDLLGDVVDTLEQTGLAEETALFMFSDHGNYAGDYGLPTKWHTGFHDALMRIPLAVRLPGGRHSRGVCPALCQHIDVFATILDLVDAEPAWAHYGRSLLPLLAGETDRIRDAVFAESGYNAGHEHPWCIARMKMPEMPHTSPYYSFYRLFMEQPQTAARTVAMRDDRWKYVWRQSDVDELYDLEADPAELVNLLAAPTPEHTARQQQMLARLFAWYAETGDVMPLPPANSG